MGLIADGSPDERCARTVARASHRLASIQTALAQRGLDMPLAGMHAGTVNSGCSSARAQRPDAAQATGVLLSACSASVLARTSMRAAIRPTSYSRTSGTARINCETMSGGVTTAATMKAPTTT